MEKKKSKMTLNDPEFNFRKSVDTLLKVWSKMVWTKHFARQTCFISMKVYVKEQIALENDILAATMAYYRN